MTTPPTRDATPEVWQFELLDMNPEPSVWEWRLKTGESPEKLYSQNMLRNVRKLGDAEQARAQGFREGVEAAVAWLLTASEAQATDTGHSTAGLLLSQAYAKAAIALRVLLPADAPDELAALQAENERLREALKPWNSKPQYEPETIEQELAYAVEEFGEALAAIGKAQRWGLESYNPELPIDQRETNRQWILRELQDAERACVRLRSALAQKEG